MRKFLLIICVVLLQCAVAQNGGNLQLAQKYEQNGETDKALSLYGEAFEKDPSPYVYELYLKALLNTKHYEQAEKVIKQFQKKSANPLLIQIDLGYLELLKERDADADQQAATTKQRTSQSSQSKKKSPQLKSEKIFQEIIDNLSDKVSPYILQECSEALLQKTGSAKYSIQLYRKARESGKNDLLYAEELGSLYRKNGQAQEMLNEFIKILKRDEKKLQQIEENIQVFIGTNPQKQQEIHKILQQQAQKEQQSKSVQTLYLWMLWQEKLYAEALKQAETYGKTFNDNGEKIFETSSLAAANNDFANGEKGFKYLIENGNKDIARRSKTELLNLYFAQIEKEQTRDRARIEKIKDEYAALYSQMEKDTRVLPIVRNLARIYGYYLGQSDSAEEILYSVLQWTGISAIDKAQAKIDLADILLYSGKVWDATLLYGQVEKDFKQDNIGFYAKLQNARLSYYIGEFEWAKSQLDVLKAATSKVIANDAMELSLLIKEHPGSDSSYYGLEIFAEAEFLAYRKLYTEALLVLDTLLGAPFEYDLYDNAWYKKGEIYTALNNVQQALNAYERVYSNYSESLLADDALFAAAELYEKTGNIERAKELYEKIFMDYGGSSLAVVARERYRVLRGDVHATDELPSQGIDPRSAVQ
ncbi:MAG: tetratricopeptide repeat protein [Bacteroidales bacterium]|jgi:tetratricopeptide (TPR) repeat protein|nr:tetratricopeptide repeat protein [Bacteroidales bacterium]